jgi:hypothetical protein
VHTNARELTLVRASMCARDVIYMHMHITMHTYIDLHLERENAYTNMRARDVDIYTNVHKYTCIQTERERAPRGVISRR